jgi:hypothetical protein
MLTMRCSDDASLQGDSMTLGVLILEDNLLWSVRIQKAAASLGLPSTIVTAVPAEGPIPKVAIVNLGSRSCDVPRAIAALKSGGTYVIGHAGHKETDLLEMGRRSGCDSVATNGEIAHKLTALLQEAGLISTQQ